MQAIKNGKDVNLNDFTKKKQKIHEPIKTKKIPKFIHEKTLQAKLSSENLKHRQLDTNIRKIMKTPSSKKIQKQYESSSNPDDEMSFIDDFKFDDTDQNDTEDYMDLYESSVTI